MNGHVNKEAVKVNELQLTLKSLEKENELNKKTCIGKPKGNVQTRPQKYKQA